MLDHILQLRQQLEDALFEEIKELLESHGCVVDGIAEDELRSALGWVKISPTS